MEETISIIIPVYNIQEYVGRCIESIQKQTYGNLEILLIDDGSSDHSLEICRKYAEADDRIHVYSQENKGPSAARNLGLDQAQGDYIGFVDGDDWIHADMFEILHRNLVKEDADISVIGYSMMWEDGREQKMSNEEEYCVWDHNEAICEWMTQRHFKGFMCDKLFKKRLFDAVRFPEGQHYMEDVAVGLPLFGQAKRVVYSGKIGYYYVQRQGSATNSGFHIRELKGVEEAQKMLDYSAANGGIYDEAAGSRYLMTVFTILDRMISSKTLEGKEKIPFLTGQIKEKKQYLNGPGINRYNRMFIQMICMGFPPKAVCPLRQCLLKVKRKLM